MLDIPRLLKEGAAVSACLPAAEWIRRSAERTMFVAMCRPRASKKTSSRRDPLKSGSMEYIAYQFRGFPTKEQSSVMSQTIGCCRFVWNRMKADKDREYERSGRIIKITPAHYKDLDDCGFLRDADSYALCNVQLNSEKAYSDWRSGAHGRPRFKKKHKCDDTYTTNKDSRSDNVAFDSSGLKLPKVPGRIRLKTHRGIKSGGILKAVTVTHEKTGHWTFTLLYEYQADDWEGTWPLLDFLETGDISFLRHIGIDMSLPHLYVDSDGNLPGYENNGNYVGFSKAYHKLESRIAAEQRKLSRMVYDSSNYRKQCERIASLHAKAKHQRKDFLEQVSARLARSYDIISIEDLDMSAIKKALRFGKSVSDNGWGMFTMMLARKCEKNGGMLVRISRWFPSSKICGNCGHVHNDLQLGDRTYVCPNCGAVMDRDENAAKNIDYEGLRLIFEGYSGMEKTGAVA